MILLVDGPNIEYRILYFILVWPNFCFYAFHFFLKILSGMANSVDPDQTAPEGAV